LSEGTINARFMNWGIAWEGVKERPLLGYGQDNYEYVFSKHYDPNMYAQEPWFDRTHNLIFDWLIAAGFLGLSAYLLILITLVAHLWVLDPEERHWSRKSLTSFSAIKALLAKKGDAFTATERALFTGLIAAYTFHNLFVFDNIVSYILFVSVLAYLHARVTEGHEPLWAHAVVSREMVTSVALPVGLVVGGLVLYYANMPGIYTSKAIINALVPQRVLANGSAVQNTPKDILAYYREALSYNQLGRQEVREQLVQASSNMQRAEGVDAQTRADFRDLAETELKRELDRNPDSARLWLFMGSHYGSIGKFAEAEEAYTKALALTPTKQTAMFQLGEIKLMQNKNEEALELFKKAYEEVPAFDDARKLYAIALIRSGKDKDAVNLLTEKFGTAAVDDTRLFNEWTNAKRFDIGAMILEARLANNPEDLQTKVSLAAAYKELGRKDEAVKLLVGIAAAHPEYKDQMNSFIKEIRGY
jgi:tetratricopeptide (TPR) repeat protein